MKRTHTEYDVIVMISIYDIFGLFSECMNGTKYTRIGMSEWQRKRLDRGRKKKS